MVPWKLFETVLASIQQVNRPHSTRLKSRPRVESLEDRRLLAANNMVASDNVDDGGVEVAIDIKPGEEGERNPINLRSRGVLPVAILGSESFDVTEIDASTARFGPLQAAPAHRRPGHVEDVNDDGFADLVLHFRQRDIGLTPESADAVLRGAFLDGTPFHGTDCVVIRGGRPRDTPPGGPPAPVPPPPPPPERENGPPGEIDVRPNDDRPAPPINLRARGRTRIAILSSADFDATQVDVTTIKLNGVAMEPARFMVRDVDGDGDMDLLLMFRTRHFRDLGILDATSDSIELSARFIGNDSDTPDVVSSHPIRIVPGGRR